MQKKKEKSEKKLKKEEAKSKGLHAGSSVAALLLWRALGTAVVFGLGCIIAAGDVLISEVEGKIHIVARFIFFLLAQSVATEFFAVLGLQVGRYLVGEHDFVSCEPTKDELVVNDPSIKWPPIDLLSNDLKEFAKNHGQPFWLNHVTGRRRCKDACMRIGMAAGSTLAVWFTSVWLDRRSVGSLGMTLDRPFFVDLWIGFCVGFTIIAFTFAVELSAGWIRFLELFEVFDRSENFARCIFWDVVFHVHVSINEELPVRGWMLFNLADAFGAHFGFATNKAFLVAMLVESAFFVVMHLPSPGGMRLQSMVNIFVGGMAGGLNVFVTGGRLAFALGWHFGWNISMGNVFGLSTSGIPISATFVAVAPHPLKQHLHGGVFGPEGGMVSPVAYCLGILLLVMIYGWPDSVAGVMAQ